MSKDSSFKVYFSFFIVGIVLLLAQSIVIQNFYSSSYLLAYHFVPIGAVLLHALLFYLGSRYKEPKKIQQAVFLNTIIKFFSY